MDNFQVATDIIHFKRLRMVDVHIVPVVSRRIVALIVEGVGIVAFEIDLLARGKTGCGQWPALWHAILDTGADGANRIHLTVFIRDMKVRGDLGVFSRFEKKRCPE